MTDVVVELNSQYVEVNLSTVETVVSVSGVPGVQGVPGDATLVQSAYRHDWAAPYSYCGKAPYGAADADSTWNVVRLLVSPEGQVTVTSAASISWASRYTATYS